MQPSPRWAAVVKGALLVAVLVAGFVLVEKIGTPDVQRIRTIVAGAGWWGPIAFIGGYAVWSLLPAPKNVITALSAVLFGFLPGVLIAWTGAMLGAILAFWGGRLLGRDVVERLLRGRLARVDDALSDHGFGAVLLVRLVPIVPYTAINYGAGVTGVSWTAYVAGTAVGMVPGTISYAALGAFGGTNPALTGAAVAALIVLSVGGWWVARRIRSRSQSAPPLDAEAPDAAEGADDA